MQSDFRFPCACRYGKRLGLGEKQIADEEVQQFRLMLSASLLNQFRNAERLIRTGAIAILGQCHPIRRVPCPTAVQEEIGRLKIDEPFPSQSLSNSSRENVPWNGMGRPFVYGIRFQRSFVATIWGSPSTWADHMH
jgi:hypothetical protein